MFFSHISLHPLAPREFADVSCELYLSGIKYSEYFLSVSHYLPFYARQLHKSRQVDDN